jgi:signal peptidase I
LVQLVPKPEPRFGEIVVFHYPVDRKQIFTKRIAGIPGDRIRIVNKKLYRNGIEVNEPYAVHKLDYLDSYRDNFPSEPSVPVFPPAQQMIDRNVANGEVIVPPGKYFVLGDNRDQSLDSRYWGFVSAADLIGKPILIYDSGDETTEDLSAQQPLFRKHTRWERLFKRL